MRAFQERFENICIECSFENNCSDKVNEVWKELITDAKKKITELNKYNPQEAKRLGIILQKLGMSLLGDD